MSKTPKQRSHFGMAGHYAAMSEFLLRGWNVAVPCVDHGDDVLVLDDDAGNVWRVQVKTGDGEDARADSAVPFKKVTQYNLSRRQLVTVKPVELHYMLMANWERRWHFILIRREELLDIRQQRLKSERKGPGRPPLADTDASSDDLILKISWTSDDARGWDTSFARYLDVWPVDFPELRVE